MRGVSIFVGSMARQVIRPGTLLWRVHSRDMSAEEFEVGEGADYPTAYFSYQQACALIEALLPDLRFTSTGRRALSRKRLAGKALSAVKTTAELVVSRVSSEEDLAVVNRQEMPSVQGILWPSAQAMPEHTMVLFGDRCPPEALRTVPAFSVALDDGDGARWLSETLAPYRVRVRPPERDDLPLVFVNYRTSDGTEEVWRLDDELRRRLGDRAVFRDHRSLTAGVEYASELVEKARGSKVLLAVVCERWERPMTSGGTACSTTVVTGYGARSPRRWPTACTLCRYSLVPGRS